MYKILFWKFEKLDKTYKTFTKTFFDQLQLSITFPVLFSVTKICACLQNFQKGILCTKKVELRICLNQENFVSFKQILFFLKKIFLIYSNKPYI